MPGPLDRIRAAAQAAIDKSKAVLTSKVGKLDSAPAPAPTVDLDQDEYPRAPGTTWLPPGPARNAQIAIFKSGAVDKLNAAQRARPQTEAVAAQAKEQVKQLPFGVGPAYAASDAALNTVGQMATQAPPLMGGIFGPTLALARNAKNISPEAGKQAVQDLSQRTQQEYELKKVMDESNRLQGK